MVLSEQTGFREATFEIRRSLPDSERSAAPAL